MGLPAPRPRRRATRLPLRGFGPEHLHVGVREPGRLEARGHRLGGRGRAARRVGRVDLDELLEDPSRAVVVVRACARARPPGGGGQRMPDSR